MIKFLCAIIFCTVASCAQQKMPDLKNVTGDTIVKKVAVETMGSAQDCVTRNIEMGQEITCYYNTNNMQLAYEALRRDSGLSDAAMLFPTFPTRDTTQHFTGGGLNEIEYKKISDSIFCTLSYDGGITEVSLKPMQGRVQQQITFNAD